MTFLKHLIFWAKSQMIILFLAAGLLQIFKAEVKTVFGISARWAVRLGNVRKCLIIPAKFCLEGWSLHGARAFRNH